MDGEALPIDMVWRDGALHPATLFYARKAAEQWGDGEVLSVTAREDRSSKSHRHYFACIKAAWENLPPPHDARFKSPEALRKHVLIRAGHCTTREIVCNSARDAATFASYLQEMDEYSLVIVNGAILTHYKAKSQAGDYQDKKEFQKSKQDVLEILAEMLGISVRTLTQEGIRQAAPVMQPAPKALPASPKLLPAPADLTTRHGPHMRREEAA